MSNIFKEKVPQLFKYSKDFTIADLCAPMEDYDSPIRIAVEECFDMQKEAINGTIWEYIVKCGVEVDREELIKALNYDRGQFQNGYAAAERKYKAMLDAFEADFRKGYKEQIEKCHGIYRCDICKHTEGYGKWLMGMSEKNPCPEDCDGYKYWEWRGTEHDDT